MKSLQIIIISFCFFCVCNTFGQIGYQKDSLQIKVYTEVEYVNRLVKDIKVSKVFCDYCSEYQTELLKEEAIRRTYLERYEEGIRLTNGKYKHALYIRISKKDFSEMKEDTINNNK